MDKRCIATINKINPATPMAPTATKKVIKLKEKPRAGTVVVPDPIADVAARIEDMTIATTAAMATIGKIIEIKLAINPNFLPDSSDTLLPPFALGCD